MIVDGDTLTVGGFVGLSVPEELLTALEKRFVETRGPCDLTLMFAAGQGDGGTRGLNHLAREGLIRRAIGGIGVSFLRWARLRWTVGSRRTAYRKGGVAPVP